MGYLVMSDLGSRGQLGSQMGNFAGLYASAYMTLNTPAVTKQSLTDGYGIRVPEAFYNFYKVFELIDYNDYTFEIFNLQDKLLDSRVYSASYLQKDVNYDIKGYFHTYHYWEHMQDEIRHLYQFNPELVYKMMYHLDDLNPHRLETVSICVRRTDYLTLPYYNLTMKYYEKAMSLFPNDCLFVIFSDDISWCKEAFSEYNNVVFVENASNIEGMCLMSLCNNNISANSTFSWWASYLNKNPDKKIICPYNYIKHPQYSFMNGNYFMKDWISLDII